MIKDFSKIKSPFYRGDDTKWRVIDKIPDNMKWVFEDDGVMATEKLDGTNIGFRIEGGRVVECYNRTERIEPLALKGTHWRYAFLDGLNNSIEKGWIDKLEGDRVHYGELIGPYINGNPHQVDKHYLVPFEYLKIHCCWRTWQENTYPKTFEMLSNWLKSDDFFSLFSRRLIGKKISSEGLVFHHPDGRVAKLRRDMFDWYKGRRH